jgi:hypothetical protein
MCIKRFRVLAPRAGAINMPAAAPKVKPATIPNIKLPFSIFYDF